MKNKKTALLTIQKMPPKQRSASFFSLTIAGVWILTFGNLGCSSVKTGLAIRNAEEDQKRSPIHNPFGALYAQTVPEGSGNGNVILRTRQNTPQGNRSVEIEIPSQTAGLTDLAIPVSSALASSPQRGPASAWGQNSSDSLAALESSKAYQGLAPTLADREITRNFPQSTSANLAQQTEIEMGLGLVPAQDSIPEASESYLGALDQIKVLYRTGRFEAALIETDRLVKQYPTSPQIHQMRGTLLERVGQNELALKSWKQALELEPSNESLRKFIDRKEKNAIFLGRKVASP